MFCIQAGPKSNNMSMASCFLCPMHLLAHANACLCNQQRFPFSECPLIAGLAIVSIHQCHGLRFHSLAACDAVGREPHTPPSFSTPPGRLPSTHAPTTRQLTLLSEAGGHAKEAHCGHVLPPAIDHENTTRTPSRYSRRRSGREVGN
jgi:hypothetical protein